MDHCEDYVRWSVPDNRYLALEPSISVHYVGFALMSDPLQAAGLKVVLPFLKPVFFSWLCRINRFSVVCYSSALILCLPFSTTVDMHWPRDFEAGIQEARPLPNCLPELSGAKDRQVLGGLLLQPCSCPPDIRSTCAVPLMSVPKLELLALLWGPGLWSWPINRAFRKKVVCCASEHGWAL